MGPWNYTSYFSHLTLKYGMLSTHLRAWTFPMVHCKVAARTNLCHIPRKYTQRGKLIKPAPAGSAQGTWGGLAGRQGSNLKNVWLSWLHAVPAATDLASLSKLLLGNLLSIKPGHGLTGHGKEYSLRYFLLRQPRLCLPLSLHTCHGWIIGVEVKVSGLGVGQGG